MFIENSYEFIEDVDTFLRPIHPSLEQDLSLKIEERDQTIWICILEL